MSAFAVRNSDAQSMRSEKSSTSLSATPAPSIALRIAHKETAGSPARYASTPCIRSSCAYTASTVSAVGIPSEKVNAPAEDSHSVGSDQGTRERTHSRARAPLGTVRWRPGGAPMGITLNGALKSRISVGF